MSRISRYRLLDIDVVTLCHHCWKPIIDKERTMQILLAYKEGSTYSEIGRTYNVSAERVRQIVAGAMSDLIAGAHRRCRWPSRSEI